MCEYCEYAKAKKSLLGFNFEDARFCPMCGEEFKITRKTYGLKRKYDSCDGSEYIVIKDDEKEFFGEHTEISDITDKYGVDNVEIIAKIK